MHATLLPRRRSTSAADAANTDGMLLQQLPISKRCCRGACQRLPLLPLQRHPLPLQRRAAVAGPLPQTKSQVDRGSRCTRLPGTHAPDSPRNLASVFVFPSLGCLHHLVGVLASRAITIGLAKVELVWPVVWAPPRSASRVSYAIPPPSAVDAPTRPPPSRL